MKNLINIFSVSILMLVAAQSSFADEPVFAPEDHCLAYKAEKVMFFLADVDVIGKSCDVQSAINWDGSKGQIQVSVPVTSFDSDSGDRDEEVAIILKQELTPSITFTSEWLEQDALQNMLQSSNTKVAGNLEVAGNQFPVTFDMKFSKQADFYLVEGQLVSSFTFFKVEVPTVGPGGLISESKDYVELLVHLRSDKITGADRVVNAQ